MGLKAVALFCRLERQNADLQVALRDTMQLREAHMACSQPVHTAALAQDTSARAAHVAELQAQLELSMPGCLRSHMPSVWKAMPVYYHRVSHVLPARNPAVCRRQLTASLPCITHPFTHPSSASRSPKQHDAMAYIWSSFCAHQAVALLTAGSTAFGSHAKPCAGVQHGSNE